MRQAVWLLSACLVTSPLPAASDSEKRIAECASAFFNRVKKPDEHIPPDRIDFDRLDDDPEGKGRVYIWVRVMNGKDISNEGAMFVTPGNAALCSPVRFLGASRIREGGARVIRDFPAIFIPDLLSRSRAAQ